MAEYRVQVKTDGHDKLETGRSRWADHGHAYDNQIDAEKRAVEIMVELQTKEWKNPRCRVIVPAEVVFNCGADK